jgi:hypothetical protein
MSLLPVVQQSTPMPLVLLVVPPARLEPTAAAGASHIMVLPETARAALGLIQPMVEENLVMGLLQAQTMARSLVVEVAEDHQVLFPAPMLLVVVGEEAMAMVAVEVAVEVMVQIIQPELEGQLAQPVPMVAAGVGQDWEPELPLREEQLEVLEAMVRVMVVRLDQGQPGPVVAPGVETPGHLVLGVGEEEATELQLLQQYTWVPVVVEGEEVL